MVNRPKEPQQPHDPSKVDFTCRPILREGADTHKEQTRRWVQVICYSHDDLWLCGHHHRQWGPVSRCMTKHVETSGTG